MYRKINYSGACETETLAKKIMADKINASGDRLQLVKRGPHFEITLNGVFLMATYGGHSEQAVIEEALYHLDLYHLRPGKLAYRVLIAGLGVGYALMPAVEDDRVKRVDVVELYEEIIIWNQKYFYAYNDNVLNNPKINIVNKDIYAYLVQQVKANKSHSNKYDLILLDVDNGPDWIVTPGNERLYRGEGLNLMKKCLNLGGMLAIWSATENPYLTRVMATVFDHVFMKAYPQEDAKGRVFRDKMYFGMLSAPQTG